MTLFINQIPLQRVTPWAQGQQSCNSDTLLSILRCFSARLWRFLGQVCTYPSFLL